LHVFKAFNKLKADEAKALAQTSSPANGEQKPLNLHSIRPSFSPDSSKNPQPLSLLFFMLQRFVSGFDCAINTLTLSAWVDFWLLV
jgi:hypothetical protein